MVALGCSADATPDAGPRADAADDAGPIHADAWPGPDPLMACPEREPPGDTPCSGTFSCDYVGRDDLTRHVYSCSDRAPALAITCLNGTPFVSPAGAVCTADITPIPGATVGIRTPRDELRPFADGEMVPVVWGPQGLPMIEYRLVVDGADAPACILSTVTMTAPGASGDPESIQIDFRCRQSMVIQQIIPFDCAMPGPFDIQLEVSVPGFGTASARVRAALDRC